MYSFIQRIYWRPNISLGLSAANTELEGRKEGREGEKERREERQEERAKKGERQREWGGETERRGERQRMKERERGEREGDKERKTKPLPSRNFHSYRRRKKKRNIYHVEDTKWLSHSINISSAVNNQLFKPSTEFVISFPELQSHYVTMFSSFWLFFKISWLFHTLKSVPAFFSSSFYLNTLNIGIFKIGLIFSESKVITGLFLLSMFLVPHPWCLVRFVIFYY